jgi:hypothetical protein
MTKVIQNYYKDFQIMFFFAVYGGMMPLNPLRRENLSRMGFLNMWSLENRDV